MVTGYERPENADWRRPEECIVGHLYALHSRNLSFGIFTGRHDGFVGIREKFDSRYLFTEYHYDTGGPVGTVRPYDDLGECPITDLRERFESVCSQHRRLCFYDESKPKEKSWAPGEFNKGTWCHKDDGTVMPDKDRPQGVSNQALHDWLQTQEDKFSADWRKLVHLPERYQ